MLVVSYLLSDGILAVAFEAFVEMRTNKTPFKALNLCMKRVQRSPILLFDGNCHLCAGSVQWVLKRDKAGLFYFAPLQSELGRQTLKHLGVSESLNSVVLVVGDRAYARSDAALETARCLGFPWSLLTVFRLVPRFIRDAVYDWIARNRYRWFGHSETCWMPKAEWKERFLN